jgi:hypothetical protein
MQQRELLSRNDVLRALDAQCDLIVEDTNTGEVYATLTDAAGHMHKVMLRSVANKSPTHSMPHVEN